ncbi:hypothetical protein IKS86_06395 [bacterium]|nr:hypothetical protein [bacterium]
MPEYTTVATITKIEKAKVYIKGFGKYLYEDSNKKQWNILEGNGAPKLLPTDRLQMIDKDLVDNSVEVQLLALSMFHKKPLKLTIEEDGKKYFITAVEVE